MNLLTVFFYWKNETFTVTYCQSIEMIIKSCFILILIVFFLSKEPVSDEIQEELKQPDWKAELEQWMIYFIEDLHQKSQREQ